LIPYLDILIFQNIVKVNVKVEDSPVQMKTQKTKPSIFSNKQLPKGCLEGDAWHGTVIPTSFGGLHINPTLGKLRKKTLWQLFRLFGTQSIRRYHAKLRSMTLYSRT
jgi:hypothetical protein